MSEANYKLSKLSNMCRVLKILETCNGVFKNFLYMKEEKRIMFPSEILFGYDFPSIMWLYVESNYFYKIIIWILVTNDKTINLDHR